MEILNRIEQEGRRRVREIRQQAEAEAERRREQVERELECWRGEQLREARRESEEEARRVLSRARARAREAVLRAKAEAARQVYERLSQEAANLREDQERYREFLSHCLRESEAEIGESLVLQIDPRDEELVSVLIEGTPHAIAERIKTLGGFVATNREGDLLVDERLETRIENLIRHHRPELSGALFAESQG